MEDNLRDKAMEHLAQAHECMRRAGLSELLPDMAEEIVWRSRELDHVGFWDNYFQCSVCSCGHELLLRVGRGTSDVSDEDIRHNVQYNLLLEFERSYHDYSWRERIREAFRVLRVIFSGGRTGDEICLSGDDVVRFKDILKFI